MLSEAHKEDICLVYQGARQCRYLEGDDNDFDKHYCRKISPDKKTIDDMVDEHLAECAKNGVNPLDLQDPIGDNCSGFVCFKDLLQGYDVEDE